LHRYAASSQNQRPECLCPLICNQVRRYRNQIDYSATIHLDTATNQPNTATTHPNTATKCSCFCIATLASKHEKPLHRSATSQPKTAFPIHFILLSGTPKHAGRRSRRQTGQRRRASSIRLHHGRAIPHT